MLADLKALARGFATTLKHWGRPAVTIDYPDVKRPVSAKFRGRHRLYRYENGLERCIGCQLCAAACPAQAIYVQAEENDPNAPVSYGERFARVYEINMIRCIFCGYCEDACPTEAIILGHEHRLSFTDRRDAIFTKDMLIDPPPEGAQDTPQKVAPGSFDRAIPDMEDPL